MITISVCMIVKNEEAKLERCLDSLNGLYEELIIVDTGSTDRTKEIAAKYTDKIYDFEWVNDFSAARNFSISKASCDYFYTADADEVLDEENHAKFAILKEMLLPEIEIVQMRYVNQLEQGTVYNYDSEYRPKLYKRQREFTFIDPVHEMVRLDPVVFDSDIDIIHRPDNLHSGRDITIFQKLIQREGKMSDRLTRMYARELLHGGTSEEFSNATPYFEGLLNAGENAPDSDNARLCYIILSYEAYLLSNYDMLSKYAKLDEKYGMSSEVATILGMYYEKTGNPAEAARCYRNALYNGHAEVSIKYSEVIPNERLVQIHGLT